MFREEKPQKDPAAAGVPDRAGSTVSVLRKLTLRYALTSSVRRESSVDVFNRHAAFANRSRASLDRTGAHVARGKHAGMARFHWARRAIHFLPG